MRRIEKLSVKLPKPLLLFTVFTLAYIVLDVFFIQLAQQSYNGTVTDEAYKKGLAYNEVLQEAKLQHDASLEGHMLLTAQRDLHNYRISFCLTTPQGYWAEVDEIKLHLLRPPHHREDISLSMQKNPQGCYHADTELADGQWEARVKTVVDGIKFYHRQRLVAP